MAVDLKHEVTRPLALILAAAAALGWALFGLSSWSATSVQKQQRLQIMEMTEKNEKLNSEIQRQVAATNNIADLEKKVLATREELTRMSQAKADVQTELSGAQRRLSTVRRDMSDADRSLALQSQKLSELQQNAAEAANAQPDVEPTGKGASRGGRKGRWSRRGRSYRSYSIMSRSR